MLGERMRGERVWMQHLTRTGDEFFRAIQSKSCGAYDNPPTPCTCGAQELTEEIEAFFQEANASDEGER